MGKLNPLSKKAVERLSNEFCEALKHRGWSASVSVARKVTPPGEDIILIRLGRPNEQ